MVDPAGSALIGRAWIDFSCEGSKIRSDDSTPPVVFLMGPTASGKTGLAVDLVARLNAEIVSVDSAMVYRGMDIGTAKPDARTLTHAPHALIDIRDPAQTYSAADFVQDAHREIARIQAAGRLPLLVGGTSLYFRALEQGLSDMPARDERLRARLSAQAARIGWGTLHQRLANIDAQTAERIHPNDAQRIQRMLEIHELTGKPPSQLRAQSKSSEFPWPTVKLAVTPENREKLHDNIEKRFKMMMASGFAEEVEKLYARCDLNLARPAMRAVGYRQLWQCLDGEYDLAEAVQKGIVASRQLAKRQLTWLRSLDDVAWLYSNDEWLVDRAEHLITGSPVN